MYSCYRLLRNDSLSCVHWQDEREHCCEYAFDAHSDACETEHSQVRPEAACQRFLDPAVEQNVLDERTAKGIVFHVVTVHLSSRPPLAANRLVRTFDLAFTDLPARQ